MSLAEKIHEGLKKHQSKHKSDPSTKVVNKSGEVDHFEVHPAEGGHILEIHRKAKEGKHGEYMGREEPEKSVHKSMSSVHKAMKVECPCGGCTQEGAENETGGKNGEPGMESED